MVTANARTLDWNPLGSAVRSLLAVVAEGATPDGELLTRYIATGDEAAFTELVRRLGPTVLGVARRALGHAADADDVFQATFLVLARKGGCVRPPGRVAAWVYGVAVLAARKALAARRRCRCREAPLDPAADYPASERVMDPDLARVLDEELERLPERLRLAVVMCELRELTVAQAAVELGWPAGTVASRLSRGRAALAARLARRGVAPAALVGVGAMAPAAAAVVPPALVSKTIATALAGGAGSPVAVLSLTSEVLKAMTMSKVRLLCVGLIAAAALAAPGFLLLPSTAAAPVPKAGAPGDSADPLDRVKLDRLAALLKVEAVQRDIGLTDDQKKKIDAARDEANKAAQQALQQLQQQLQQALPGGAAPPVPGGAPQVIQLDAAVLGGEDAGVEKVARDVLQPEQVRRLKQISLQVSGPAVLIDRKVIRALGLTADQEDKIEAAVPASNCAECNLAAQMRPNAAKEAAERTDKAWAAALKVLTPEQKAAWDKLTGKLLPTAELQKAQSAGLNWVLPNVFPGGAVPGAPPGM